MNIQQTLIGIACAAVALSMCCAPVAIAGPINSRSDLDNLLGNNEVLEDFETYNVADGNADLLFTATLDSNTVANGQGPGLVQPGARYKDPTNFTMKWDGNQYSGMQTKTLEALAITGVIEIDYTTFVQAMGLDIKSYDGEPTSGTAKFYDSSNNLLGTTPFTLSTGGAESVFVGWENLAGVKKVVISSSDWPRSPVIDNHGYGEEPLILAVSGDCPGQLTVQWSNGIPGGSIALGFAFNTGHVIYQAGPCKGTPLGLGPDHLRMIGGYYRSDSNGMGSLSGTVSPIACGHYLQLLEGGICRTSNVVQIP